MSKILCILAVLLACAIGVVDGQLPEKISGSGKKIPARMVWKDGKKFPRGRGRKVDPVQVARRAAWSKLVHGERMKKWRKATATSYDCRTLGQDTKVQDQGECGNCYEYSGSEVVACGQLTASIVSLQEAPAFQISVQWLLDYHPELGGCDGGDEWQVAQLYMTGGGGPDLADYPGAGQNPGQQQPVTGKTFYTIVSMGYCDPNQQANGVAATQTIKDGLVNRGPVSIAVAAGSWGDPGSTPITGNDTQVDHAIMIVGYIDNAAAGTYSLPQSSSGGYWIIKNSWNGWGIGGTGYAYIEYGADSVGTEAFFVTVSGPAPPGPPPPPIVPPVPPSPPAPPAPPSPGATTTITLSAALPAGSFEVVPSGTTAAVANLLSVFQNAKNQGSPPPITPMKKAASPPQVDWDKINLMLMKLDARLDKLENAKGVLIQQSKP